MILLLLLLTCTTAIATAATVAEEWIVYYDAPINGNEYVYDMKIDSQGNVLLSLQADGEMVTVKFDSDGNVLWEARYQGTFEAADTPVALAVDSLDNVIVTGSSDSAITTIKYDSGGEQLWINQHDEDASFLNYDQPAALAVDGENDVLVGGVVCAQLDDDELVCVDFDFITIKYTASGDLAWSEKFDGGKNDCPFDLAVDEQNNVAITGQSLGAGGPSAFDFVTIVYDAAGNEKWLARFDGPFPLTDIPAAMTFDPSGNVIVVGEVFAGEQWFDIATVKYDAQGNELWRSYHDGPAGDNDEPVAVATDDLGNVFVAGISPLAAEGNDLYFDYVTIKYDSSGTEQWIRYYDGLGAHYDQQPADLTVDQAGNAYLTGVSFGGSAALDDFATLSYDPDGNDRWTARFNEPQSYGDLGKRLSIDGDNNVYVAGDVCVEVNVENTECLDFDAVLIKYKQTDSTDDDDDDDNGDDDDNDDDDDDDGDDDDDDDDDDDGCGC
ncbi:MAG TPA: hypothetical protein PKW95_14970 [bacterium]|nr:hypothetical protein [bacterium]